ncbi:MAG: hypothetical protein ACI37S_05515 [Candidatus Gastranaerophilaceae bacterium]
MDSSNISSNSDLTNFINQYKNAQKLLKESNKNNQDKLETKIESKNNQKTSPNSNVILAKKGSAGFIKQMDLNNDGQVSLEEFNKYCEENNISEKDKLQMLQAIISANSDDKTVKSNLKDDDETKVEDKAIYAKKGDEKYNEDMDLNKNGVVTYAEYLKYLNDKIKSENSEEINSENEDYIAKEIKPEVDSTVEFEV